MLSGARHGKIPPTSDSTKGEKANAVITPDDWAVRGIGIGILKGDGLNLFFTHAAITSGNDLELVDVVEMRRHPWIGVRALNQKGLGTGFQRSGCPHIIPYHTNPAGTFQLCIRCFRTRYRSHHGFLRLSMCWSRFRPDIIGILELSVCPLQSQLMHGFHQGIAERSQGWRRHWRLST